MIFCDKFNLCTLSDGLPNPDFLISTCVIADNLLLRTGYRILFD